LKRAFDYIKSNTLLEKTLAGDARRRRRRASLSFSLLLKQLKRGFSITLCRRLGSTTRLTIGLRQVLSCSAGRINHLPQELIH